MRKEIRGLKAGTYWSEDDSALLRVTRNDAGPVIEIADFEAGCFYEFMLNEDESVTFNFGAVDYIEE